MTEKEEEEIDEEEEEDEDASLCLVCWRTANRHRTKKKEKIDWTQCDKCDRWAVNKCVKEQPQKGERWECKDCLTKTQVTEALIQANKDRKELNKKVNQAAKNQKNILENITKIQETSGTQKNTIDLILKTLSEHGKTLSQLTEGVNKIGTTLNNSRINTLTHTTNGEENHPSTDYNEEKSTNSPSTTNSVIETPGPETPPDQNQRQEETYPHKEKTEERNKDGWTYPPSPPPCCYIQIFVVCQELELFVSNVDYCGFFFNLGIVI